MHQVHHNGATDFLEWRATILYVKPDSSLSQFRNYTCNATNLKNHEKDIENIEIVRKYPMSAECLNVIFEMPLAGPIIPVHVSIIVYSNVLVRLQHTWVTSPKNIHKNIF